MSDTLFELHQRIDGLQSQITALSAGGRGPGFEDFAALQNELRADVAALKSDFATLSKDLRAAISAVQKQVTPVNVPKLMDAISGPIADHLNAAKDRTERQIEAVRSETGASALAAKNAAKASADVAAATVINWSRAFAR